MADRTYLPDVYCPSCEEPGSVYRTCTLIQITVGSHTTSFYKYKRSCDICNEDFENSKDGDWRKELYAAIVKGERQ